MVKKASSCFVCSLFKRKTGNWLTKLERDVTHLAENILLYSTR